MGSFFIKTLLDKRDRSLMTKNDTAHNPQYCTFAEYIHLTSLGNRKIEDMPLTRLFTKEAAESSLILIYTTTQLASL